MKVSYYKDFKVVGVGDLSDDDIINGFVASKYYEDWRSGVGLMYAIERHLLYDLNCSYAASDFAKSYKSIKDKLLTTTK